MEKDRRLATWRDAYREMLLGDVIAFWMNHAPDREYGGFLHYLDRDGSPLSGDKSVWIQGRATWLFAHLYNRVEAREEWRELSNLGRDFLRSYGFDSNGRMFFAVTREGKPLRKRRYYFSETFAVMGLAENALANQDLAVLDEAIRLFKKTVALYRHPDQTTPPKIIPETRQLKGHSVPMILLVVARTLRAAVQALNGPPSVVELCNEVIRHAAIEVGKDFYKPQLHVLLERVHPDGSIFDTPEGRVVNPGHCMETAWFLLEEGIERNNDVLKQLARNILVDALEIGWDREHGGVLYFVDAAGKPSDSIEHDMKLWWPHSEALYATLLAYHAFSDPLFLEWHERIRDWTMSHFPDREMGEWYGYLHYDGTVCSTLKGNMWKGPFHIPRALLRCVQLLDKML